MPDETTPTQEATLAAITALTVAPDNYPSPVDVAAKLGITRQALYQRLNALEESGLIERRNHGHALKVLQVIPS